MKKLIPALALLVVSAILMGTSTFAWFAMNSEVTVTGMKVHTKVSDNLFIAPCEVSTTAKIADETLFRTAVVANIDALLEPVSTINGVNFFYTSTSNVVNSGDATTNDYTAYTPGDTTAFNTNYGTSGAVGYADYAFQIKAVNTNTEATKNLQITGLTLTYGGNVAQTQKAFRTAIFVDDMGETGGTAAKTPETASPLKTIMTPDSAVNFESGKAVNSTSSTAALSVAYNTSPVLAAVPAGKTNYYKVVVRLWLEGEDTTCTVSTFANLTDEWALDIAIELGTGSVVTEITQNVTASKVAFTTSETATTEKTVAGTTYYQIGTKQVGGKQAYTTHSGPLTTSDRIFTITSDKYVTEVTNQCSITDA